MNRMLILAALLLTAACAADGPQDMGPTAPLTLVYVDFEELNRYLNDMNDQMLEVERMLDEFTVVSQDWVNGRTSSTWTRGLMGNLLKRHANLVREAPRVRPTDPRLQEVHLLYEDGLRLLGDAYTVFDAQIEVADPSLWDGINADIVEGTLQFVRFQFGISELAGVRVRFINL